MKLGGKNKLEDIEMLLKTAKIKARMVSIDYENEKNVKLH